MMKDIDSEVDPSEIFKSSLKISKKDMDKKDEPDYKKADDLASKVMGDKEQLPRNEIRNGLLKNIPKMDKMFSKEKDPKTSIVAPTKKIMKKLEKSPTVNIQKE